MCATHATLIDDDEVRFTIPMLETWKSLAEYRARLEQSSGRQIELDATKTTEYGLVAESFEISPQEAYSQKIGDKFNDCCVREMWGRSVASAVRDAVIELTMNALTHGRATRARITFSFAEIELSDDGVFFDPQTIGRQSRTGGGAETIAQLQTRFSQHLLVTHKFKNGRNCVSFSYIRTILDITESTNCYHELKGDEFDLEPFSTCERVFVILPNYLVPSQHALGGGTIADLQSSGKEVVIVASDVSDLMREKIRSKYAAYRIIFTALDTS